MINAGASGVGLNAGTGSLLGTTLEMGGSLPIPTANTGLGVNTTPTTSQFGLNPTIPTGEIGTFNPSITSGYGVNTGAASGIEYLGGAGSLPVGTAGLTAEQIAQAELAGSIGSNASSGLGYLGGAESLPSGTAGITGVTAPTSLSLSDIQRGLRLGQALLGGQQPTLPAGQQPQQEKQRKMVDYSPILNLLALRQASTPNIYSLLG
jgi:hypothetical protein